MKGRNRQNDMSFDLVLHYNCPETRYPEKETRKEFVLAKTRG